jgi:putative ABC transport system substrate-binding protein
MVPTATMIGVLVNPSNQATEAETRELKEAARVLGLQLHILNASTERDLSSAFVSLGQQRAGALLVATDALLNSLYDQLAALAGRLAVPTIHQTREFAAAGGLMSYGASIANASRQAAIYVGRIVKGEKPADLPVQQSTKVELVINLKTAKALGLSLPLPLTGRADEVIE